MKLPKEIISQRNLLIMYQGEVRHLQEIKERRELTENEAITLQESQLMIFIIESMIQTSTDEEKK